MKSNTFVGLSVLLLALGAGIGTSTAGNCPEFPPLFCPPADSCHGPGQCDPETGQCANPVLPNGSPCDDGNTCTSSDTCQAGICTGGLPLVCNDQNACTDDSCMPGLGCVFTANAAPCDDGNQCTTADQCSNGFCTGGPMLDCDDQNSCTTDFCAFGAGCQHFDNQGQSCDDGNACTQGDTCQAGVCTGGPPIGCDDQNTCTDDACLPGSGCTFTPNAAPCSDGNDCTIADQCSNGSCASGPQLDCNDQNTCTTDFCMQGTGCQHFGSPGQPCNDGDACTQGDTCNNGTGTTCGGTAVNCNDGNSCTIESCDPVTGCVNTPSPNQPCTDGNACTLGDTCDAAGTTCIGGAPVVCTPLDICHVAGTCDPATGCSNPPVADGTSCADADICNGAESCQAGVCRSGFGPDCDDDNPCTTDTCSSGTGCSHAVLPNGATCDDLDACDGGELCQAGTCTGGTPLDCSDPDACTDDLCFPIKRETRSYTEHTVATEITQSAFSFVTPTAGLLLYTTSHHEFHDPNTVTITVLKFAVDPARVQWIVEGGTPRPIAPNETFELIRTTPYGVGPTLSGLLPVAAAATDIGNGRSRVLVPYHRYEGGCTFINQLGGPECMIGPGGRLNLNGDSDPFDAMLSYFEVIIDRPSKTILSIQDVMTNTEGTIETMATNGRYIAHFNPEAGDADCRGPGPLINCYEAGRRVDRNGDGQDSYMLSLHDVDTDQTTYTLLKTGVPNSDLDQFPSPEMGGDLMAFLSWERPPSVDYNNDGDTQDVAIRFTSVAALFARPELTPAIGPVTNGQVGGRLAGVEGTLITYALEDLRLFDTVTRGDVSTDAPMQFAPSLGLGQVAGGIEAISTHDGQEQRPDIPSSDFNGDGDYDDTHLRFYEHATRTIVTTNLHLSDVGSSTWDHHRFDGISDGEIIAYAYVPYPYSTPMNIEIRFIRVAPCSGVPCGEQGDHCFNADVFDGTPCADGDLCNGSEVCQSGNCIPGAPVICSDLSVCTNDQCVAGLCEYTYNTDSCDDGNGCTASDTCSDGACVGTPISAPPEVTGVRSQPDKETLTWVPATYATSYSAVRGSVSALPVGPGGGEEVCFGGLTSPALTDTFRPPSGAAVWYLVRGTNSCGTGDYGTQSNGPPRLTSTCP